MPKKQNKRQLHCAEALRLVKKLRDERGVYDPVLLKIFVKKYFVDRAPELNLNLVSLDNIVGGVMGMLAREDKQKRSAKEFGYDNLMSIYALEDQTIKAQREAQYKQTIDLDLNVVDWNEVEAARKHLIDSKEVSGELKAQESEEPDFAAILESRATEDHAGNETVDDALAGFEELDSKTSGPAGT